MLQNGDVFLRNGKLCWNVPPNLPKNWFNFFQIMRVEIFGTFTVFLQYNSKPQFNGNWFLSRQQPSTLGLPLVMEHRTLNHWIWEMVWATHSYMPWRSLLYNATEASKGFLRSVLFQEILIFQEGLSIPILPYSKQYAIIFWPALSEKTKNANFCQKSDTIENFGPYIQRKKSLSPLLVS